LLEFGRVSMVVLATTILCLNGKLPPESALAVLTAIALPLDPTRWFRKGG
jgi:hypothetical protein